MIEVTDVNFKPKFCEMITILKTGFQTFISWKFDQFFLNLNICFLNIHERIHDLLKDFQG